MLSEQIRIEIGNKIRDYRVSHSITQSDFAEAIGISVNFLSEIENGKKRFSSKTLYNICHKYDISADRILLIDKPEDNPTQYILTILNSYNDNQLENTLNYINALRQVKF